MTPQEYYRLTGPTEKAGPPEFYSPTALGSLRICVARWQLIHSTWGDLPRHPGTPNRHRVAGAVIHDLLEAMFRQLGQAGGPPRGTAAFREAMRDLDVRKVLAELLDRAASRWAQHPRTQGSPLALDPRDLLKRAFETFRRTYRPASAPPRSRGSSAQLGAEVTLKDEALRLRGRVDLARATELVEFKTGLPRQEHRRQLEMYALLWRRQRGVNPTLSLVYPGDTQTWTLTREQLDTLQVEIAADIERFDAALRSGAAAEPGDHCQYCPVRAFCEDYWARPLPGDMELHVSAMPTAHAVGDGSRLVRLHAVHVRTFGKIEIGDRVRILGAINSGADLSLPPWGELYLVSSQRQSE